MLLFNTARFRIFPKRKNARSTPPSRITRDELNHLVHTADSVVRKTFNAEMQAFFTLYSRYLTDKGSPKDLDWDKVQTPDAEHIVSYDMLPKTADPRGLSKLAILKLDGGLGTSFGMTCAKSALEVKDGMTFLDLTVRHIEHFNRTQGVDIPLFLMTSFNTHEDTLRIVQKYADQPIKITIFNQSRYPRIYADTLRPSARHARDDEKHWYPAGHGDLYESLVRTGILDRLLAGGKEYLFVSNSDNLGAVVDQKILQHMVNTDTDFLMEVTHRTKGDIEEGVLVQCDDSMRLLENAQVPSEHVDDFNSTRRFKIFNTNSLWINLKALKKVMGDGGMNLEIIANLKVTDGESVIQLETAAGAAIKHFRNARGIHVPRSRFLPIKSSSDLLLIKSNIYSLKEGRLIISDNRMFGSIPVIKLGDHFTRIQDLEARFKKVPTIIDLDHLTVAGDVCFGRGVTLRGTVIIVAKEGQRIDIPDGCVLENRLVSGNFSMIDL